MTSEHRINVIGIDHIYLTVSDFTAAEQFYDVALGILDFRKGDIAIAGERHRHYFNRVTQISIRPAHSPARHDPYAPGLHHLCLQVASTNDVDRFFAAMREAGLAVSAPAFYPQYDADYYATFFCDPDGLRHEVVARRRARQRIVERWVDLTAFVNPRSKLKD